MKAVSEFEPEFVVSVPQPLEHGKLYVSMEFATVIHLCACGCGNKVVTPLKTAGWELRYNGEGISLSPSVGCWSFPCRSHYWIRENRVIWSNQWSDEAIRHGREETIRENLEDQRRAEQPTKITETFPENDLPRESSFTAPQAPESWVTKLFKRITRWK